MLVSEFMKNATRHIRAAVTAGKPLEIENYRKPYAVVVPIELWRRAEQALADQEKKATKKSTKEKAMAS